MKNQTRSELTQNRIMQSAIRLFAEQGFNAAGVAEICADAQVSKGAFYHHFKSKNTLFVALLESWLSDLDQLLSGIAAEDTSFPEQLLLMTQLMSETFDQFHDQIPILFEFWMQASRDEEIWQAVIAPFQRYQNYFAGLIQKGIEDGDLERIDPQVGAQTLISLAVGMLLQGMLTSRSLEGNAAPADPGLDGQSAAANWGKSAMQSVHILLNGLKRCK